MVCEPLQYDKFLTRECIRLLSGYIDGCRQWRQSEYRWTMSHISSLLMAAQLLHNVTSYHFFAGSLSVLQNEKILLECSAETIK
jgi:hypothetical protein